MASFVVDTNFQYGGAIREVGFTLDVDDREALRELKLGRHKFPKPKGSKNFPYISGLWNHCTPADRETERLLKLKDKYFDDVSGENDEEKEKRLKDEAEAKEKLELHEEFKKIGKDYDNRWGLQKLKTELIAAKKVTGN